MCLFLMLCLVTASATETPNIEINFGNSDSIFIQYSEGYNVTLTKPTLPDITRSCGTGGDCCYCSGVQAAMCNCGNSFCCYNSYKHEYYTCGGSSVTCCSTGSSEFGCAKGTGCEICSF